MKKLLFLPCLLVWACGDSNENNTEPVIEAQAVIHSIALVGDNEYEILDEVVGNAYFVQGENSVSMTLTISQMEPDSAKAVHIHNGTLTSPGHHWNAQLVDTFCETLSLGVAWGRPFAGDVGNVTIDEDGNGTFVLETDLWSLNTGNSNDVLNKVIIVHENAEDFAEECSPDHVDDHMHTNTKIAGGLIELITEVEQVNQTVMSDFPEFTICR